MDNSVNTIEDCLELLAGMKETSAKFQYEKQDYTIMTSVARQVFKGTALTDRQFELMQEKLQTYLPQLEAAGYKNASVAIESHRQPLRNIDRSKYIKLIDYADSVLPNSAWETKHADTKLIKIRFPFSKSLILNIENLNINRMEHKHEKGSHEHYFWFNEINCFKILSTFINKNFEIDQVLIDYYNKIKLFENNQEHISGIVNYQFKNVHPSAIKHAVSELGEPCAENIVHYKDRSKIYGIASFDNALDIQLAKQSVLTQKIVNRTQNAIFIKNTEWTFDNLIESLLALDRFPLAILLHEKDPFDNLVSTHRQIKDVFANESVSVQFRLPSDKNNGFNDYIHANNLNSPVDNQTKVVYTSIDKLNKPLLQSNCKPKTALLLGSQRLSTKIQYWLSELDLVIHYDTDVSYFEMKKVHSI